jgi:phosphatidylglycerophosphate synthase
MSNARPEISLPDRRFFAETGSKFEPFLIKTLCEPILPHIPASVHPNTISLVTHGVAWCTALLAVGSVYLEPLPRALALIGAGIGMFLAMLGDCLDGLHARRTNQCSKLGEMMDHWLDAIIVPLATVGITCALELPPWAIVAVNVTAAMVYNAQLVLYHHSGRFIHPEATSGVEGQFGLSLGYVGLAGLFYYFDRNQSWIDMLCAALALAAVFVQMKCNWFYYAKLGKWLVGHLWLAGIGFAFGALYLAGALDLHVFLLLLVFTSFRLSGTYVLRTLVKQRYGGGDLGLVASALAIAGVHFAAPGAQLAGVAAGNAIAVAACLYAIARNFIDFAQRYRLLQG